MAAGGWLGYQIPRAETALLAMAARDARMARRIAAAALALGLQAVLYWLMLHEAVEPTAPRISKPLQVSIFETARRLYPATLPRKRRSPLSSRRALRHDDVEPAVPAIAAPSIAVQPTVPPAAAKPASHTLHWEHEIQREARESRSRAGKIRFGFPQVPAPAPATPEFGWDYAHTHRLQALSGGGMLINLNDHCALVIYGLMLVPGCRIGRIPVNGQLFDHMYDRRNNGPDALP